MNKPAAAIGSTIVAVAASAVAVVMLMPPEKPLPIVVPPPVPACEELRGYLERDFAMRMREERRAILKDAANAIRHRLKEQRARNPKAAPPLGVEEYVHDLDRRAAE